MVGRAMVGHFVARYDELGLYLHPQQGLQVVLGYTRAASGGAPHLGVSSLYGGCSRPPSPRSYDVFQTGQRSQVSLYCILVKQVT